MAFGQAPKGYYTTLPVTVSKSPQGGSNGPNTINPLPLWNYSVTAYNAQTYTGTIVGRSPFNRGKTTTTIPTQIVPLIITINDGTTTVTYDPTAVDPCVTTGTHTDVDVITGSPIFTNNSWTMDGQGVGTTQYIDAFQRTEFWSLVAGTPYHLVLNQSTLPSQALAVNSSQGTNYDAATFVVGGCGKIGVVDLGTFDSAVQSIITGSLAGTINIGTFPIFLTRNVVLAENSHSIFVNCCVLGYHSGMTVGPNLQIYSPFSLNTNGVFGGDVSTLSHEMGEAIDDPKTNNPTPVWGRQGQQFGCQNNFEVGDPLSPGGIAPTSNEFVTVGANGLTYHLQELADFSWFFGGTNLGISGHYSNNGTFTGFAKACPPGGTN
ncbi:MAG TPA: hypothetical protein VG096_18230 [Bryobacteraceae bacterium]|jgi:hypothetical protein|nr:hypothetical protein [Bryobacteraceae bacterium]